MVCATPSSVIVKSLQQRRSRDADGDAERRPHFRVVERRVDGQSGQGDHHRAHHGNSDIQVTAAPKAFAARRSLAMEDQVSERPSLSAQRGGGAAHKTPIESPQRIRVGPRTDERRWSYPRSSVLLTLQVFSAREDFAAGIASVAQAFRPVLFWRRKRTGLKACATFRNDAS